MGDKDMRLIKEFKLPIYFSMYYVSLETHADGLLHYGN